MTQPQPSSTPVVFKARREPFPRLAHLSSRSVFVGTVAFLFFYFPAAKLPPVHTWDNALSVPVLTEGLEFNNPLTQFLYHDTLLILLLAIIAGIPMLRNWHYVPQGLRIVLTWTSILLTVGGLLSITASAYPSVSTAYLIARTSVLLFVLLLAISAPTVRDIHIWVRAVVLGASVIMFLGVMTYYQTYGIPLSIYQVMYAHFDYLTSFAPYARVTFGNPAQTQEVILLVLPVCLVLALSKHLAGWERLGYVVASVLLLTNMVIAFERWAIIMLLPFIALVLLRLYLTKQFALLWGSIVASTVAAAAILFTALADPRVVYYFTRATDPSQPDNTAARVQNWLDAAQVILHNPAGVGWGMSILRPDLPNRAAHSLILGVGVEGGILAAAGTLLWIVWQSRGFIYALRDSRYSLRADLAFGLQLSGTLFAFYTLVQDSPFYSYGIGVWMALWLAFPTMAAILQHETTELASGPNSTGVPPSGNHPDATKKSYFHSRGRGNRGLTHLPEFPSARP